MTPTVDFPTLRTQLLQVVDELPDAINPMRGGTCVYELVTPAGEVHNCVMGRWAVKFGHPIPDANESASAVFCGILTEKAQHFADTVQSLADEGRNPNRPQPLRWGGFAGAYRNT